MHEEGGDVEKENLLAFFRLAVISPRDLHNIRRWRAKEYAGLPDSARDTTLEHTLSVALTVRGLLAVEGAHPEGKGAELNHLRILTAAITHDLGEGVVGDMPWIVKRDPRVRAGLQQIESEQVIEMFDSTPPAVRDAFHDAYQVPHELSADGRFFDAAHLLAQLALAILRYQDGHRQFIEAFRNILGEIVAAEQEFVSIRLTISPFRDWLEREVARHDQVSELRRSAGVDPE